MKYKRGLKNLKFLGGKYIPLVEHVWFWKTEKEKGYGQSEAGLYLYII